MKKILFLCSLLILLPLAVIAQDVPDPPANWSEIIMNPQKWFVDFGAVAVLTAFVATFFIGLLKVEKKFLRQVVAWAVAIVLLVVTDLLNFGYAKDFPILLAVIHGLGAGLAANGVFNIPLVKAILNTIEEWLNPQRI